MKKHVMEFSQEHGIQFEQTRWTGKILIYNFTNVKMKGIIQTKENEIKVEIHPEESIEIKRAEIEILSELFDLEE